MGSTAMLEVVVYEHVVWWEWCGREAMVSSGCVREVAVMTVAKCRTR